MDNGHAGLSGGYPQGAFFGGERMGLEGEQARDMFEEAGINLKQDEESDKVPMDANAVWQNSMNAVQSNVDVNQGAAVDQKDYLATGNMVNSVIKSNEALKNETYGTPEALPTFEIVNTENVPSEENVAAPLKLVYNKKNIVTNRDGLNRAGVGEVDKIIREEVNDPALLNETIRGEDGAVATNLGQSYQRSYGKDERNTIGIPSGGQFDMNMGKAA